MKQTLTQEQKDKAIANAKAVREKLLAGDTVAVIAEFKDEWLKLEKVSIGLITETGRIVMDMAAILEIEPTENGKSQLIATIRACIGSEGTLMQYARKWAGIALALVKQEGEPIKVKDSEGNVTAFATVSKLKDLNAVSQAANEIIGIKPRGIREKKASTNVKPLDKVEIWPALAQVLENEAGRAAMRRFLNQHGYEMVALSGAKKVELQKKAA